MLCALRLADNEILNMYGILPGGKPKTIIEMSVINVHTHVNYRINSVIMCKQRRGVQKYHEVVQVVQQVMETRDYSAVKRQNETHRGRADYNY